MPEKDRKKIITYNIICILRFEMEGKEMIKIYGMDTCPDCTCLYDQIEGRASEFEYINIGEHVKNLKEFLRIRDNSPVFDECKEKGYAGIPCFVFEDGRVSITPEDAGLKSRSEEVQAGAACGLDGKGC